MASSWQEISTGIQGEQSEGRSLRPRWWDHCPICKGGWEGHCWPYYLVEGLKTCDKLPFVLVHGLLLTAILPATWQSPFPLGLWGTAGLWLDPWLFPAPLGLLASAGVDVAPRRSGKLVMLCLFVSIFYYFLLFCSYYFCIALFWSGSYTAAGEQPAAGKSRARTSIT